MRRVLPRLSVLRRMESRAGTYALVLSSTADRIIRIGRLGRTQTHSGFYVYVGSAFGPGGVRARVGHHQIRSVRPHWHIDFLRACTTLEQVWYSYDLVPREHHWARLLRRGASACVEGFGCSDCKCESHLYFFDAQPSVNAFRRKTRTRHRRHAPIEIECRSSDTQPPSPSGRIRTTGRGLD